MSSLRQNHDISGVMSCLLLQNLRVRRTMFSSLLQIQERYEDMYRVSADSLELEIRATQTFYHLCGVLLPPAPKRYRKQNSKITCVLLRGDFEDIKRFAATHMWESQNIVKENGCCPCPGASHSRTTKYYRAPCNVCFACWSRIAETLSHVSVFRGLSNRETYNQ
jgi:hypothetical protein